MMPVLCFLLTFGSCAQHTGDMNCGVDYRGYEQTIPMGFIANYVYNDGGTPGKWLTSPVVFKLTNNRDTMFMYTAGRGYAFPRIKDSVKCYIGYVGQNKIKFTIRESSVDAMMPDLRTLRIVNKSMI